MFVYSGVCLLQVFTSGVCLLQVFAYSRCLFTPDVCLLQVLNSGVCLLQAFTLGFLNPRVCLHQVFFYTRYFLHQVFFTQGVYSRFLLLQAFTPVLQVFVSRCLFTPGVYSRCLLQVFGNIALESNEDISRWNNFTTFINGLLLLFRRVE